MTPKTSKKSLSIAVGTALGASLALSPMAIADTNPFGMTELPGGYMQVAGNHGEGKCGEGKCGDDKAEKEGSCGEGKCGGEKAHKEGSCGEGKCGGDKARKEGSCGEGKCGGDKAHKEGSCGEGKCGGEKSGEGKCVKVSAAALHKHLTHTLSPGGPARGPLPSHAVTHTPSIRGRYRVAPVHDRTTVTERHTGRH